MKYDSRKDTLQHIEKVQGFLYEIIVRLKTRSENHDASKLGDKEKPTFDRTTPLLKGSTYGSDEYKQMLADMKPALDHHYKNNRHHPEHFSYYECNGCFKRFPDTMPNVCDVCGYSQFTNRADILRMNLIDIVEMFCDWKAASMRHNDGDILNSIKINSKRFEIDNQLKSILEQTVKDFGW